jgi:transposase
MERDRLVALLEEGLSLDGIARRTDRSPSTVSYWLAKHGLHANGAARFAPRGQLDRETLAALVAQGLSAPAIAERLECSHHMVRHWLKHHGLKTRQAHNREAARDALARGQRLAELTCREHGLALHVLEGRGSYRCCLCRADAVGNWRRRLKRTLIAEAGGRCVLCGYDRCPGALQFHHLDPTTKSYSLSHQGVTRSLARARAEAKKCVLLCATCHAEVETGFTSLTTG